MIFAIFLCLFVCIIHAVHVVIGDVLVLFAGYKSLMEDRMTSLLDMSSPMSLSS